MKYDTIITIVLFVFLLFILYFKRNKLQLQKIVYPILYMFIYRTEYGLKLMDRAAKRFPRILDVISIIGIFVGFAGMVFIAFSLFQNFVMMFIKPSAQAGVALVLPVKVPGAIHVPVLYWIISIIVLAIVHEFAHGVMTRLYKVKVKSSGFAVFSLLVPLIPAAFVEPDEKALSKKSAKEQLGIFAAGPFANVVLAFVCLGILILGIMPLAGSLVYEDGVAVISAVPGMPAENASITDDDVIVMMDETLITNVSDFINYMNLSIPGQTVLVKTRKDSDLNTEETLHSVMLSNHPDNNSVAYIGLQVSPHSGIRPEIRDSIGWVIPRIAIWFVGLFYWLFLLNLGIGLFNLVPLGPLDGGRMMNVVLLRYFKKERAVKIFKYVSILFLAVIVIPLLYGFIKNGFL